MSHNSEATRARLIGAAEQLFAAHGVDAVSLRQINRAAGARNATAVQYHFEDRQGVLRAILEKHWPDIEARRHAMLDDYEADDVGGLEGDRLRMLVGALVRPSAAKLADPDGGRAYLQISASLINRPDPPRRPPGGGAAGGSIRRWRALAEPLLQPDAVRLHRRFDAMRFSAIELGRRARSAPRRDDRLFVSHLIDLVAALLAAPVSGETARFADGRARSRPGRPQPAGSR